MARERAGVIIVRDGSLLMTLAKERRWRKDKNGVWRVPIRWLGGKLNGTETYRAAAVREVQEEVVVGVRLEHSPAAFVARPGSSDVEVRPADGGAEEPQPLLVSLREHGVRSVSYAGRLDGEPSVGDVPGLLWVPLEALTVLAGGLPFRRFEAHGIELSCAVELPSGARAVLGATGTEHLTQRVVARYGADALTPASGRSVAPATQLA